MKMKKYLMTGIAALALCAGFTSCSHDLDVPSPEKMKEMEAQKIVNNYEKAFKAYVGGNIAANQTWGFGPTAAARTRAMDVKHNEWYSTADGVDPKYGLLEEDPVVTDEERIGVFRYMNKVDNREKTDNIIWDDYFVSQVWDGGTNYILNDQIYGVPTVNPNDSRKYDNNPTYRANDKITNNGLDQSIAGAEHTPFTTSYANNSGQTVTIPGGDYMDYLFVNETGEGDLANGTIDNTGIVTGAGGWVHINNFNSSNNFDEWYAGKTWMTNNSGTYDFAYNQSNGGTFFSHKYLIISGNEIFANDPVKKAKYGQYYYVCFDFEKPYTDAEKANDKTYGTCKKWVPQDGNPKGGYWQDENWELNGYYDDASSLETTLKNLKGTNVQNITINGYLYGSQHFDGDNNYTDWIVRISPARYKNTNPDPSTWSIRVMAEDLSATEASDFDFNDVVLDFFGTENSNVLDVTLQAAGGTLPLRINQDNALEVHNLFDVETNVMVNTNWTGSNKANKSPVQFTITLASALTTEDEFLAAVKNVILEVEKTGADGTTKQWLPMNADQGKAAAKFAVPIYDSEGNEVRWANERESLKDKYGLFSTWATTAPHIQWWNPSLSGDE